MVERRNWARDGEEESYSRSVYTKYGECHIGYPHPWCKCISLIIHPYSHVHFTLLSLSFFPKTRLTNQYYAPPLMLHITFNGLISFSFSWFFLFLFSFYISRCFLSVHSFLFFSFLLLSSSFPARHEIPFSVAVFHPPQLDFLLI